MSVARGKATDFSCVTMKNMTMKGANFLEKLLDNQPVEWKKLGEVFITRNGYTPSKSNPEYWEGGTIPWYRMEDIRENGRILSDALQHITPKGVKGNGLFKANSIILATTATIGEHALITTDALCNQQLTNFEIKEDFKDKLLSKFVFYYFYVIDDWCKKNVNVSSFPSVSVPKLKKLDFPIPPLSVQSRIVEILDKFTSLEAELEAELELRKKQYAYYREQLLNFSYTPPSGFNVVYKKLGEVCKVQRGASPRPITKYLTDDKLNGIPWIKIGDTKVGEKYIEDTQERITQEGARKSRLLQKGDFVLSNSMSYGRPYILGISGCIHDGWASLSEISNSVLPDYLYYYLSSNEVQHYWTGKINSGSVSNLNSEIIKQLPIPIPPLSEQARIVEILDKFDTLTNSISEGLPLEIKLRRQQYEYYREQLLDFRH